MADNIELFKIPVLDEDDDDKLLNVRHFQPGKIIEEAKATKSKKDEEKVSLRHTNTEQQTSTGSSGLSLPEKILKDNSTAVSSIKNGSKPSTSFENAFANLKSSKFYESVNTEMKKDEVMTESLKPRTTNSIIVNPRQKGNPLLKSICHVPWEFGEIEPDYIMGKTTCALFLSLRYHNLFPNYIHDRLKSLGKSYKLRVLLAQVDVVDPNPPLKDLSVIAILADCTLMLAWSCEDAGKILETYKMFENKSADLIMKKQDDDVFSQLVDALTCVRSINRTDAMLLLSRFGSLEKIIKASPEELSLCPGMGPLKAQRLYDAFHQPISLFKSPQKSK